MRKLSKMQDINRGDRSLIESTMMPEVIVALRDWARSTGSGVLIGALALSYHCKPRYTQDIDFLFLEPSDVPDAVGGFSRIGSGFPQPHAHCSGHFHAIFDRHPERCRRTGHRDGHLKRQYKGGECLWAGGPQAPQIEHARQ